MILFTLIIWVIGAALTAKADAMNTKTPTSFGEFCIALVCWPAVAVAVCRCKHNCAYHGQPPDYHY